MVNLNKRVKSVLTQIKNIEPGEDLTITTDGKKYQIYHKAKLLERDLTLTDLKKISRESVKIGIVQFVDVSQLVNSGRILKTDRYVKIKEDVARSFLHTIHGIRFENNPTLIQKRPRGL